MSWKAEDFDSEWPFHEQATKFEIRNNKVALLVIDIQKGDLVKDSDSEYGIKYPYIVDYWNKRMSDFVLPNTSKLISFFRELGLPVIYTRNGAITPSGNEMAERLRVKRKFKKELLKIAPEILKYSLRKLIFTKFASNIFDVC